jgi:hypothetical protein
MAKHFIDLVADGHIKKHEYGHPISLQESQDVEESPLHPAAAAATLEGVDINDKFPPSLLQRVPNPWN